MARIYGTDWRPLPKIDHGRRSAHVGCIVVHDMESDNLNGVEDYFRSGATEDNVGAHFGIAGAITKTRPRQWADTGRIVYHAVGGNATGVGIELCGYASQSRAKWIVRRGQRIALAELIARLCHEHGLGLPHHGANVLGHGDVSRMRHVAGGHTDPGPNFPWDATMKLARKRYRKWMAGAWA